MRLISPGILVFRAGVTAATLLAGIASASAQTNAIGNPQWGAYAAPTWGTRSATVGTTVTGPPAYQGATGTYPNQSGPSLFNPKPLYRLPNTSIKRPE